MQFLFPTLAMPAAAALLPICAMAQGAVPESPAIWRDVTGVQRYTSQPATFTRPHLPGLRTTADGRIGVVVEGPGTPRFGLIKPEKANGPFLRNPAGAYTVSWTDFVDEDSIAAGTHIGRQVFSDGIRNPSHACVWDDGPPFTTRDGRDVYDFKVLVTTNRSGNTQFFTRDVRVTVTNPKTAAAAIDSVQALGTGAVGGNVFQPVQTGGFSQVAGFEPMIVGDGRLLVLRVASPGFDPPGAIAPDAYDFVYSYYEPTVGGVVTKEADVTLWKELYPITYAPSDSRINTKFGFAMQPFRDAAGNTITPGKDLGGSYPWMDREATNLFFEGVRDRLRADPSTSSPRYPHTPVTGDMNHSGSVLENLGYHQGVSMIGLWTHGKIVQLDNLLNDMDYAIGDGSPNIPQTRMVELYQNDTDPNVSRPGTIELGYGRASNKMPPGENDNGSIIDSLESKVAYRKEMSPIHLHDIAWLMTNGKQSDEVGFDDYNDPDAFVVANMSGLLTWNADVLVALIHSSSLHHHSGWNESMKVWDPAMSVRLQNAATAPSTRWNVPAYGEVVGNGRLEPAAAGGVRGKGFWMDGAIGLRFDVPAQPGTEARGGWYAGVFVDSRTDDDGVQRRVLTFPDGTSIQLLGRSQVLYVDGSGTILHRITVPPATGGLPDLLPKFGWAHLAVQIRDDGHQVDLHLNGLLLDRWTSVLAGAPLFQMPVGALTLGKVTSEPEPGFSGWTDDLKVFAHTVDPETACNLAAGTLVGVPTTGPWKTDHADRYPDWVHAEVSEELRNRGESASAKYAPFHDYTVDLAVFADALSAAGVTSHRDAMHFPEGPLYWNKPRPNSSKNPFCITCHQPGGLGGLSTQALTLTPGLAAFRDPRRQPSQPPAVLHGVIPQRLVNKTNHAAPQPAASTVGPVAIDKLMLEAYAKDASVESFTLVDANTGLDLFELVDGMTLDPARLATDSLAFRANLDVAQGNVFFKYDTLNAIGINAPHVLFPGGIAPQPGLHDLQARGDDGVYHAVKFTVPAAATWREVADYREDFVEGSPHRAWSYWWNSGGDVATVGSLQRLVWNPVKNNYSGDGLTFPDSGSAGFASFTWNGGHPGAGSNQSAHDRNVVAVYQIQWDGDYRIVDGKINMPNTPGTGSITVMTQSGATRTVHSTATYDTTEHTFSLPPMTLTAGDLIMVAVGPDGAATGDTFRLGFGIDHR